MTIIMKLAKLAFIPVLFFCVVTTSHGQEVGFGVKGGLNLSSLNLEDPEASYDSRTGYHLGLFFEREIRQSGHPA